MSYSAGNVYSEIVLDISKYMDALSKAEKRMSTFESTVKNNSAKMESSLSKIDKQYKLWELNASGVQKALQGNHMQVDTLKQKISVLDTEIKKSNDLLSKAPGIHESIGRTIKTHEENLSKAKQQYKEASKAVSENEDALSKVKDQYWKASEELKKHKEDLSKAKQQYGKNSDEVKKHVEIVNKDMAEVKKSSVEIEAHEKKLTESKKAYSDASCEVIKHGEKLDKAKQKYEESGEEIGKLEDHVVDLKIKQGELNQELEKFSFASKLQEAGDKMEKTGETMSKYITAPIVGVGLAASKLGMDFEANMSRVQAISGATGTELERMNQVALKLGADTAFSATEVATSMEGLASAGFTVNETINALPGLLDLAASSGADLGTATDIAASALRGFQLDASESGRVADVFAEAANRTNAQVEDMGEAMKYIAPVANAMGMSIEETAAAVGILSNAGIKGGQAGTVLRGALTRLTKPTEQMTKVMDSLGLSFFDAQGNMLPLEGIIRKLEDGTKGLTQEQKNQALATLFGQEALSGMLVLVDQGPDKLAELTDGLEQSGGAAKKAADIMQDNTKGAVEQMTGALETAGIKIFQVVAPHITSLAEKVGDLADKFSNLSPATQETILKLAGVAAAAGPLLIGAGKLTTGIGSVAKTFGLFSTAAGAAATATGGATAAAGGLGATLLTTALPIAGIVAGLAAVTAGGIALYNHLSQESIPAVDLFGDSVSESTQKAVGAYMELDEQATVALNQLAWSSQEVTEEMATSITGNVDQMKNQVVDSLTQQKTDGLAELEEMFSNSKTMSEEEKAEMLRITSEKYDEQITQTEEGAARIAEILRAAKEGNRAITDEERTEINKIQEEMKETAVQTLSDSEAEQMAILERLKVESGNISARQAAEVVANSIKQKEETIAEAEAEYTERLKYAAQLKADGSAEGTALADKIIEEATRQRDESVAKATEMHDLVVEQAKLQAGEHVAQIDWEAGEVKSRWQRLIDWFKDNPIVRFFKNMADDISGTEGTGDKLAENLLPKSMRNAQGTNYWRGGWSWVGEEGPELIELPRGTKVYPHEESVGMAKGRGDIYQTLNIYSPTPLSPSEVARKNMQAQRQLALEWGY